MSAYLPRDAMTPHRRSMVLADRALNHRRKAEALFVEAMELEEQAASLMPEPDEFQNGRRVLYTSAANLAQSAGLPDDEARLRRIAEGGDD